MRLAELPLEELSDQKINQFYHAYHGAAEAEAKDAAEGC
jgi:hypothetical protein